jgi:hypothetical protein
MPRKPMDFAAVFEIGLALPDVIASTSYGAEALKIGKQLMACRAINKSADPDSLMVRIPFADRDRLLEEQPELYYITDHYLSYPCILVRVSAIRRKALEEILGMSWRFVMEKAQR